MDYEVSQSVRIRVVHTTCAACGACIDYEGAALGPAEFTALQSVRCRCGEAGQSVITMASYRPPLSYQLRKLPAEARI